MGAVGRPRAFDTERALDAAVEVFWRHGFEGASLAALATAMGVNKPSIYAAFGDKAQLFHAALRRYVERNMGYVDAALARPTARECAEAFLVGNARAVTRPDYPPGCLSVQAAVVPGGSNEFSMLAENRADIHERFAQRFRRAVTEGDLPPEADPDEFAGLLITLSSGFAIRAADGTPRGSLEAIARRAVAVFPTGRATGTEPVTPKENTHD